MIIQDFNDYKSVEFTQEDVGEVYLGAVYQGLCACIKLIIKTELVSNLRTTEKNSTHLFLRSKDGKILRLKEVK